MASFGQSQSWPASLRSLMLPGREAVATTAGGIASNTSRDPPSGTSDGNADDGFCSALSFGWKRLQARNPAQQQQQQQRITDGDGDLSSERSSQPVPNISLDELRSQLLLHPSYGPRLRSAAANAAAASLAAVQAIGLSTLADAGGAAAFASSPLLSSEAADSRPPSSDGARLTPLLREGDDSATPRVLRPAASVGSGDPRGAGHGQGQLGSRWKLPSPSAGRPSIASLSSAATRADGRPTLLVPREPTSGAGSGLRTQADSAGGVDRGSSALKGGVRGHGQGLALTMTSPSLAVPAGAHFPSPPPPILVGRRVATASAGIRGRKFASAAGLSTQGNSSAWPDVASPSAGTHVLGPHSQGGFSPHPLPRPSREGGVLQVEPGLTLEGVEAAQRSMRAAHTQKTAARRVEELSLPLHARNPYAYAGGGRWTSTKHSSSDG